MLETKELRLNPLEGLVHTVVHKVEETIRDIGESFPNPRFCKVLLLAGVLALTGVASSRIANAASSERDIFWVKGGCLNTGEQVVVTVDKSGYIANPEPGWREAAIAFNLGTDISYEISLGADPITHNGSIKPKNEKKDQRMIKIVPGGTINFMFGIVPANETDLTIESFQPWRILDNRQLLIGKCFVSQ